MMAIGKAALRTKAVDRRRALPAQDLEDTGTALVDALLPLLTRTTAVYASVGAEPDTGPLRAAARAARRPVLLPVLLPDGDLDWALDDDALVPGPHGLLQPSGPRLGPDAVADCGLVVVPALAVAQDGTRLGRGGGSYDRVLLRANGLVVAALHRGELVDDLPAEAHDQPVDAVVLPDRGLVRLRRSGEMGA